MPELSLKPDFLGWFVAELREFEMSDLADDTEEAEPGEGGGAAPSGDLRGALASAVERLTDRQQAELVALVWTGRALEEGQSPESFGELVALAEAEHVNATSEYLLGMPLLPDYLAEAADHFGLAVES